MMHGMTVITFDPGGTGVLEGMNMTFDPGGAGIQDGMTATFDPGGRDGGGRDSGWRGPDGIPDGIAGMTGDIRHVFDPGGGDPVRKGGDHAGDAAEPLGQREGSSTAGLDGDDDVQVIERGRRRQPPRRARMSIFSDFAGLDGRRGRRPRAGGRIPPAGEAILGRTTGPYSAVPRGLGDGWLEAIRVFDPGGDEPPPAMRAGDAAEPILQLKSLDRTLVQLGRGVGTADGWVDGAAAGDRSRGRRSRADIEPD